MHQALPYKPWQTVPTNFPRSSSGLITNSNLTKRVDVKSIVKENAVIVFGQRGCCMSHVVRRLLLGLWANPAVYEVDEHEEGSLIAELEKMGGAGNGGDGFLVSLPTIFIGGRWFGGLDRVMATHITGDLTPILREAGALWL